MNTLDYIVILEVLLSTMPDTEDKLLALVGLQNGRTEDKAFYDALFEYRWHLQNPEHVIDFETRSPHDLISAPDVKVYALKDII